jgi:hypothetical protein
MTQILMPFPSLARRKYVVVQRGQGAAAAAVAALLEGARGILFV